MTPTPTSPTYPHTHTPPLKMSTTQISVHKNIHNNSFFSIRLDSGQVCIPTSTFFATPHFFEETCFVIILVLHLYRRLRTLHISASKNTPTGDPAHVTTYLRIITIKIRFKTKYKSYFLSRTPFSPKETSFCVKMQDDRKY